MQPACGRGRGCAPHSHTQRPTATTTSSSSPSPPVPVVDQQRLLTSGRDWHIRRMPPTHQRGDVLATWYASRPTPLICADDAAYRECTPTKWAVPHDAAHVHRLAVLADGHGVLLARVKPKHLMYAGVQRVLRTVGS